MKQFALNVALVLTIAGIICALCVTYSGELQPQEKVAYPITLDELYTITTKDNVVYKEAKINITQLGCFVIRENGYVYIPIDKIKSITEVKHGGKNGRDNGRNMERDTSPDEREGQHL